MTEREKKPEYDRGWGMASGMTREEREEGKKERRKEGKKERRKEGKRVQQKTTGMVGAGSCKSVFFTNYYP